MGCPVVITGPSGAGKSSVCRALHARWPEAGTSISATTRAPRGHERDGEQYHFLSPEEFEAGVRSGEFLEWEEVHGDRYGTRRQALHDALAAHPVVLLDVDPKGGLSIRRIFPETLLVFLKPPSPEVQRARLEGRDEDSGDAIQRRMQRTREELALAGQYDLVVINDDLERTVDTIDAFITQRRLGTRERSDGT